ncbi:hypothetical protein C3941_20115 [Kaistia algarum]|uniref:heparan-alpha-glucosaminide N-acetyltransferase n=1 Tax=Kaistia algarum TaxID=2083279 RepID=UPI000CE76B29|nr:heparan-alpha-glucosaminide N-acetyltransferase [Kaistia algarum]MCX5513509.1 heparan-alpha-glucosaminide N-acetyltransferase [Kaistia algarum]PPE78136.1 hypothetical protein C3941_20115 [Kaistia algarum]
MGTANLKGMRMNEAEFPRRIALIDVIRGVALIAMAVFHGAWDVSYFKLLAFDPGESIGWTIFARLIAGTFVTVSGISLVLATRGGFRPMPYFRRLAMVVAAAIAVSVATYILLPEGWVFFGILHQIALASVLALPFLRLPNLGVLVAAAFFLLLPQFFRSDIFATPALWWVGLAPLPPPSFDYVPLFPWFGCFLFGTVIARFALAKRLDRWLAQWSPRRWPGRALGFGGRHSLIVYLVHQPILFGFFFILAHFVLPGTVENTARTECRASCMAHGFESEGCVAYCGCVYDSADTAGLKGKLIFGSLSSAEGVIVQDIVRTCSVKALAPPVSVPAP